MNDSVNAFVDRLKVRFGDEFDVGSCVDENGKTFTYVLNKKAIKQLESDPDFIKAVTPEYVRAGGWPTLKKQ